MNISDKIFSDKLKVFFVGAMGSGKTEIAINYANYWAQHLNETVGLVDLDMIKPYFRLRNVGAELHIDKVEVVMPRGKYSNVDFPFIPPSLEAYVRSPEKRAVIDVGGDDLGARLIGRYRKRLSSDIVDLWYVYNGMRPLSRGLSDVAKIMESIEHAGGFKITGMVHNSHLMTESTVENLLDFIKKAEEIAEEKNLEIKFHCIREDLYSEASKKLPTEKLLPLKVFLTPSWL